MRRLLTIALTVVLVGGLACSDDESGPTGPTTGSIEVLLNLTGEDLDPDGLQVSVDGGATRSLVAGGSVTFRDLAPGSHSVLVDELAGNCDIDGQNPRTVTVMAGHTFQTTFSVECTRLTGSLEVRVTTTGYDLDQDGFQLLVDGAAAGAVQANGTTLLADLTPGRYAVSLSEVAANCAVDQELPLEVTVTAGLATQMSVTVECQPTGRMSFSSSRGGQDQIYTINADGTGLVNVSVLLPVEVPNYDWSPDGSQIAFECDYAVCVINSDGTDLRTIADDITYNPTWSPDGTQIAFQWDDENPSNSLNYQIWGAYADGSGLWQISDNEWNAGGISIWSWDGRWVAWVATHPIDTCNPACNSEIWVATADGQEHRRLTDHPSHDYPTDWSPDGSKIVFRAGRDDNNEGHIMSSDGTEVMNLTNHPADDYGGSWSPDGSKIAFGTNRDGNLEVYVMNADGSSVVNLTNHPADDYGGSWSPDGSKIAFVTDRDGNDEIYIMKADGTDPINLTNHPADDRRPGWFSGP